MIQVSREKNDRELLAHPAAQPDSALCNRVELGLRSLGHAEPVQIPLEVAVRQTVVDYHIPERLQPASPADRYLSVDQALIHAKQDDPHAPPFRARESRSRDARDR